LRAVGFRVFALDRAVGEAEEHIIPIKADITSGTDVVAAFEMVCQYTDSLCAIVHFAGIYMLDSLVEMSDEQFRQIFNVNVHGVFAVNRTFLPLLKTGSRILITTSEEVASKVSAEVDRFAAQLSRKAILEKSLDNYGYILLADNMNDAIDAVNEIASEHLELVTKDAFTVMTKIKNAGAIFIGEYSSEPLGDYFAGPNHVLPTNGTAKFFSPLEVDDFIKKSSIISYSREALETIHEDIIDFAKAEGLTAHANSIAVRFGKEVK
jgi:hypothetical protein